jgi:hypothetical protein
MHIVELMSTGDGQIMETLDKIGIKLFVLCSASVSALQIVFSDSLYESTAKWETYQIFKVVRLLVHV